MIPKHLHFIFGLAPKTETDHEGRSGWGLSHYVCVASAITKIKPEAVSFYLENEPSGPWWDLTKPLVNIIPIKAPTEIFGNPVSHYAHKADVIRLERLIKHGGIYLDVDVFVHESFDALLKHSVVMGLEGEAGLCNAVIMAEKDAPFVKQWYDCYRTFDNTRWSNHSVILPYKLAQHYGPEVVKLPETAFFWPTWRAKDIYAMFGAKNDPAIRGDFANHLWEQRARHYLKGLTPGHVRKIDTPFHSWARPYVGGLPDEFGQGFSTQYFLPREVYAKAHTIGRICKDMIVR